MNELQQTTSWLDFSDMGEDGAYLREKAVEYASIDLRSQFEKGRILEEIAQKYSTHRTGCYCKFCEKLNISTSSADRYRKIYNFIFPNWENKDEVPNLLNGQFYALASGKTNPQLVEAVKKGEVKNSKEYKEMEKRLADSERAREQAEQENATLTEQYNAQAKELQDLKGRPATVVEVVPSDYNEFKTNYNNLQSKCRNLQSANESYARANEELHRKLAKEQANKSGMSLQELAEEDKAFAEYRKTKHQEAEDAKKFYEAIRNLSKLPNELPEIKELCRCYIAHEATEANRAFTMKSMAQEVRLNIRKLEAALEVFEQGKLSVVK